MLQPKKTKFRRQQKGRQKGIAQRGNQLAFGSFGIKALETKWITGDRKSTRLNSSHKTESRMPSSA